MGILVSIIKINMKIKLIVLGVLCFMATAAMFIIGLSSSALSELRDFWYIPFPIGIVALIGAFRVGK